MNEGIEKIIYDLERCCGMFDYMLTPIENNLLVSYIKQLQQENQQLSNKLGKYIEQRDEWVELLQKYKSVLDEIREFIDNSTMLIYTKNPPRQLIGTDKLKEILDKVKE